MNMLRCMLKSKRLANYLWGKATTTIVYVLNISPTKRLEGKTPEEASTRVKPNVAHFRVFGSICFKHVPDQLRRKLDDNTFIRKGRSYSSFFNFAYATILSRNIHQPITLARFLLNFHACGFHTNLPYSHFTIWVNIVVQRGLEHLHIEIPHALELPKALF